LRKLVDNATVHIVGFKSTGKNKLDCTYIQHLNSVANSMMSYREVTGIGYKAKLICFVM